jgi:hypothetical protein
VNEPHDEAAIAAAKQLVDGSDMELWEGTRNIAEFKRVEKPDP